MINKDSLISDVLNGQSKEQYLSLLICGAIGLIASLLVELIRHKDDIKTSGGFSFAYYLRDNFARMLLSIIIITVGVLYSKDLVGIEVGNKGALAVGFMTDKIIEMIISLKLNNVLGSLIKPKE